MPSQSFTVKLINSAKGIDEAIQVNDEQYILDVAEEQGIDLPYSCRNTSCVMCLGKVIEGTVEQDPKAYKILKHDEIEAGYILTCTASPTSDCTIVTHQEEELY